MKRYQDYGIVPSTVMIPWVASLRDMMVLQLLESKWRSDAERESCELSADVFRFLSARWLLPRTPLLAIQ